MKRFLTVLGVGVGIGFVLGSKAGREPYERLEAKLTSVSNRDDVSAAIQRTSAAASDVKDKVVGAAAEKVEEASATVDDAVRNRPDYQRTGSGR
jgi:hypothetical protein